MVGCTLEQFGGNAGVGNDNSESFLRALDHLRQHGGGTLTVTAGVWETGPITIPSHGTLMIEKEATIAFIDEFERYRPVWTRWEGVECHAMQPCIQARDAYHVSIAGEGTIDGRGQRWWEYRNRIRSEKQGGPHTPIEHELALLNPSYRHQPGGGGGRLSQFLAPPTIQLYRCHDCSISGVTVINSPFWTIHPLFSERITIEGISVLNPPDAPNSDGLDIDSCSDVTVSDCLFDVGDDAIALKSGSGRDGMEKGIPTQRVDITRCTVKRAHGGIVIGSETAGGIRSVRGSYCTFIETDRGIRIKTRRTRGGVIEDLHFSDITMQGTLCPIAINMYYRCGVLGEERDRAFSLLPVARTFDTPVIRDISISRIEAIGSKACAGFFVGLPESPITRLLLADCHIDTHTDSPVDTDDAEMFEGLPIVKGRGMRFRHCTKVQMHRIIVEGPEQPYVVEDGVEFA